MVQNLRLGLTAGSPLSKETTNLVSKETWTPDKTTQTSGGEIWGTGSDSLDDTTITDTEINITRSYSGPGSDGTTETQTKDGWVQNIGIYYNYYAATAGSGTSALTTGSATDSVCPKSWKLPDNSGQYSYHSLLGNTYGLTSQGLDSIRTFPLSFVYTGLYAWATGEAVQQSTISSYWTSSAINRAHAFLLGMYTETDTLVIQNGGVKAWGCSIRCVAV